MQFPAPVFPSVLSWASPRRWLLRPRWFSSAPTTPTEPRYLSLLPSSAAVSAQIFHPGLSANTTQYIRWSGVAALHCQITISMLWGNIAYRVKLSGEDSSYHSNITESVSLRKCSYYHYLTKKAKSHNKHFSELAPHHGGKTDGIDMVWRNYVTATLCIHPIDVIPLWLPVNNECFTVSSLIICFCLTGTRVPEKNQLDV